MRRPLAVAAFALPYFLALAQPAVAAWPNSPLAAVPVCTAPGTSVDPWPVSDGAGGVIVAWNDSRVGFNFYAQRLLASGEVDPAWPANGLVLCGPVGFGEEPQMIADGAGGAIVCWRDTRTGVPAIYVQRVLASGVLDPAWPPNGRALTPPTPAQTDPAMVADGAGGAIIAWYDQRLGVEGDIYAQRVLASGVVDPAWPAEGIAICTAGGVQEAAVITTDGAGGAIIAWEDYRWGGNSDVYATRVLASGIVDPAWPTGGLAVCSEVLSQNSVAIVPNGTGGAILAWEDWRSGSQDLYGQLVLPSGTVAGWWPVNGRLVAGATGNQNTHRMISDGLGGAILAWMDWRGGGADIYAQRLLSTGVVDPAWSANGRQVCTQTGDQYLPMLAPDGTGGAFITWQDPRNGLTDVYAHHVLVTGQLEAGVSGQGLAVSTAGGYQTYPRVVEDGIGGMVITWLDTRNDGADVYAQRVGRYMYLGAPEAAITGVTDVPNDQGGKVKLAWNASYLEGDPNNLVTHYKVFRSVPTAVAASRRAAGARVVHASDSDAGALDRPGALLAIVAAGTTYFWEYLATVDVDYLPTYSYLAATASDSTASGAPLTAFMVQARTAGTQHWESLPMSGYSVDNLAPAAPGPFAGYFSGGTTTLHWNPNPEADLAGYRLYRGASAGFTPGPATLVAALADTGYADASGGASYYKLSAIDVHGNESPVATLSPAGTVGVGDGIASRALTFAAPSPNPAVSEATLRYALPRAAGVRLAVYDASGRLVREVANGARAAGDHAEAWDLRDATGRAVSAGLYFARLEAEGRNLVRRVAIAR